MAKPGAEFGVIVKNIPLKTVTRGGRNKKYYFEKMEIGDSMLIKGTSRASIYHAMAHLGIRLVCRKEGTNWRVWRVAQEQTV